MSLPHENVLLVPNRNVLLTGSGWGGGKHRSTPHEAAGSRPAGSAEQDFADIDIEEALDIFGRGYEDGRPFSVIVVDLALRKTDEDEAKKWFRNEDHAREWLTTLSEGSLTVRQELLKIFGGLHIIKQIRRRDPLVSIFVVSQFAGTVAVQDLIRRVLGAHVFESLDILFKDGEWEKLLENKVRELSLSGGEQSTRKEQEFLTRE